MRIDKALFIVFLLIISSNIIIAVGVKDAVIGSRSMHVCAITDDDSLYCWGDNSDGQLGTGDTSSKEKPTLINNMKVKMVSAGEKHTCAITTTDDLYCWGDNEFGQLGTDDNADKKIPTKLTKISNVETISVGGWHTCAVKNDKTLYCWGKNSDGQLGTADLINKNTPTQLTKISDVTTVSAGGWHTCATAKGKLYCWGKNSDGQLGTGDKTQQTEPKEIVLTDVKIVSSGAEHTCAVTSSNKLYCWGTNTNGRLGTEDLKEKTTPTEITKISDVTTISLGGFHTCAIKSDKTLYCWGQNTYGRLGTGDLKEKTTPTEVNLKSIDTLRVGARHSCAIKDKQLYCWGYDYKLSTDPGKGLLKPTLITIGESTSSNTPATQTTVLKVSLKDELLKNKCLDTMQEDIALTQLRFEEISILYNYEKMNIFPTSNVSKFYAIYSDLAIKNNVSPEILFAIISLESRGNFNYKHHDGSLGAGGLSEPTLYEYALNKSNKKLKENIVDTIINNNGFQKQNVDIQMNAIINALKVLSIKDPKSINKIKDGVCGVSKVNNGKVEINSSKYNLAYYTYDEQELAVKLYDGLICNSKADVCNDLLYVEKVNAYANIWRVILKQHGINTSQPTEITPQEAMEQCIKKNLLRPELFDKSIAKLMEECKNVPQIAVAAKKYNISLTCKSTLQIKIDGQCFDKCEYCANKGTYYSSNETIYNQVCGELTKKENFESYTCQKIPLNHNTCVQNLCYDKPGAATAYCCLDKNKLVSVATNSQTKPLAYKIISANSTHAKLHFDGTGEYTFYLIYDNGSIRQTISLKNINTKESTDTINKADFKLNLKGERNIEIEFYPIVCKGSIELALANSLGKFQSVNYSFNSESCKTVVQPETKPFKINEIKAEKETISLVVINEENNAIKINLSNENNMEFNDLTTTIKFQITPSMGQTIYGSCSYTDLSIGKNTSKIIELLIKNKKGTTSNNIVNDPCTIYANSFVNIGISTIEIKSNSKPETNVLGNMYNNLFKIQVQ